MYKYFFIRLDSKYQKIQFDEIKYVEACKNYIRIVTTKKAHIVLITMKQIERVLPSNLFCRVHRSYIVSLNYINAFDHELVYMDGIELPLSVPFQKPLQNKVMIVTSVLRCRKPVFSNVRVPDMLMTAEAV
jgi:two-component system, LytTR family, response regulator